MKDCRTTAAGILSAAASFVLFASQLHMIAFPAWVLAIAMFAHAGGLAMFGVAARDADLQSAKPPSLPPADPAARGHLGCQGAGLAWLRLCIAQERFAD